jgi:hypothetical protein
MLHGIFKKKCILHSKTFVLPQQIQLTFVCRFSWLRLLKTKPILSWRASGGAVILSSFSVATNSVSIFVALAIDGWKTWRKMTTHFWQYTCLQINTSWNAHLRFLSGALNFNIYQRKILNEGNLTYIIIIDLWSFNWMSGDGGSSILLYQQFSKCGPRTKLLLSSYYN